MNPVHVKVVFRRWKGDNLPRMDLVAIFPEYAGDSSGGVLCYEHYGQHGSADYRTVLRKTSPVTGPQARADGLAQELEGQGYVLDVRMGWSNHWKMGGLS